MGERPETGQRVRGSPAAGPLPEISVELPCAPDSAVRARHVVADACRRWGRTELRDSAELVATELVANAIRHAHTSVRLTVRCTALGLQVEVVDDSPRMPQRRDPGLFDESGRGLWLVDAIAARWGVERERPGKRVWAEIAAA